MRRKEKHILFSLKAAVLAMAMIMGTACLSAFAQSVPETEVTEALAEGEYNDYAQYYDQMKSNVVTVLEELSSMTDQQLEDIIEYGDAPQTAMAAGWQSVKDELGVFTGAGEQTVTEDRNSITVDTVANYDQVSEKTKVNVSTVYSKRDGSATFEWDVKYPLGKLVKEAGLNTLLGMGTVFIVLLFLSFVIGNIHWVPDLVEKRKKSKEEAKAAEAAKSAPAAAVQSSDAAAAALAADTAVEEDDSELAAVIAAAVAAFEGSSSGFVVRSIKKAARKS